MLWEKLWSLEVEEVEIALEFTDMEAPVLKQGCCPTPALPLMFLIAPKEKMQADFLVCRCRVSTG
jgi:hypothetical protein